MSVKTRVYLAGPINETDECVRWREDIISATNTDSVEYVNPLDLEVDLEDPEDIVKTDLRAIRECDAMILHYEPGVETWGTPMEAFAAKSSFETTVIVWLDRYDGKVEELPKWLQFVADEFERTGRNSINKAIRQG